MPDSTAQTPDTVERRKLAIVQEVLYGHDKLQDVLSESDKAMSVVKDLFGDDPKVSISLLYFWQFVVILLSDKSLAL